VRRHPMGGTNVEEEEEDFQLHVDQLVLRYNMSRH
jgi:hypothetical protein